MYNHSEIEKKWAKYWEENKTFKTNVWDFSKPKYYALDMFPYPSAQGLHVGHPTGYIATDIVARLKRMQGYNVLHPMGFDSFGLPAEQYAIKTGNHPGEFTKANTANFRRQLKLLGLSYDWDRELSTADPNYFKWTQWIFKSLYNDGLARYEDSPVNWCEELGTVLANDEIIDGKSERGGFPVERKLMKQWIIDMPAYAEKLLNGLDELDWPESTKEMQRNWIGKSEGARVKFKVANSKVEFEVFTTRIDTLFGATYCVLAPEKDIVLDITSPDKLEEVKKYIVTSARKNDLERTNLNKDKTGVFVGAYAINPANNCSIPIYIADYVLDSYGTGAIMAVPAHDERDYEFAKKHNLPIVPVLEGGDITHEAYLGDGKHINSGYLNGLNREDATTKILEKLSAEGVAQKTINYRLRDWIFARQRYWGEPLPIVHMTDGSVQTLADNNLPLELPVLNDYRPLNGSSPLAKAEDWVNVVVDGKIGKRETNTMPGSAGSSWYFLRYVDPFNDGEFADKKLTDHWLPVDLYVGGSEHAVGHLLYSRLWNRYLCEKGLLSHSEPFKKLVHQGMILGENGIKMSKSLGNVVNPDDCVSEYGADALRLYEMFLGPITGSKPWGDTKNIAASKKFIERIWNLISNKDKIKNAKNPEMDKIYHATVKKVTHDYESLDFNTAISQLMIFVNAAYKTEFVPTEYAEGLVKMLSPVAPFAAEEMWQKLLGKTDTITYQTWPKYDEKYLEESTYELPVQINGKLKAVVVVGTNATKDEITKVVLENETITSMIDKAQIKEIIIVPKRIANIIKKS